MHYSEVESRTNSLKSSISWLMPLTPHESPIFLESTLKCLEKQTLLADELVIAGDGPLPEGLIKVINGFSLPLNLYLQSNQKGIGATLATVALKCRGELIVRIDSDDLYAPQHTENLVKALEDHSDFGVVGCQLLEIDTERNYKKSTRKTPIQPSSAKRWLPWRNPLNHQTVAIRRTALLAAGGYRHVPSFEDWDLWLRISEKGYEIANLNSCSAAARVDNQHRKRRRGFTYFIRELNFYSRQIKERRIKLFLGLIACLVRLPWRLLPGPAMKWWMQSKLRGSPTIDTPWLTKSITNKPR